MRARKKVERRLAAARQEVARLRTELRVLDEQVVFQRGDVDDARVDAAVAGPMGRRKAGSAAGHLRRLERQRAELRTQVAALESEQDALLERLLEPREPETS